MTRRSTCMPQAGLDADGIVLTALNALGRSNEVPTAIGSISLRHGSFRPEFWRGFAHGRWPIAWQLLLGLKFSRLWNRP